MAAPVRRYYLHTDPRYGLTSGLNHIKILDGETEEFQGLGTTRLGLTIYKGDVGSPSVVKVSGTPEIAFGVWTTGQQTSDPLVWKLGGFTWDEDEQAYVGDVNFNTLQLRAALAGKVGAVENSGASYDLALADAPKLIALTHSAAFTAVLKAQADIAWTTGITLVILNNSTQELSIDPATGVTINALTSNYTVAAGDLVTLTRTAENTWTAAETSETDELSATGQWGFRTAGQTWERSPWFGVEIRDPYVREGIATPASTLSPDAYVTDAELAAEVADQLNTQLGTPVGGMIPDASGNALRGEAESVQVLSVRSGNWNFTVPTNVYTGSNLQDDLLTLEADTLTAKAMFDLVIEGVRWEAVDASDGGYRNAITLDTVDVVAMQREHVADFAGKFVAYTWTGQLTFSAVGASGRMHFSWMLQETDGTTIKTYASRVFAPASTDSLALDVDTTNDINLGISAAYLAEAGQSDHSIRFATIRRKL